MSARERERAAFAALEEARRRHDEAREVWTAARKEADEEARVAFEAQPTPDGLVYAAAARCPCGAGLAYPKHASLHGSWDCSAILLGTAIPKGQPGSVQHTDRLPFAFYDVKAEQGGGLPTTRPKPDGGAEGGR